MNSTNARTLGESSRLLANTTARGLLDEDAYRRQLARLRTMRSDAAKKVEAANAELDDEWLFTAQRTLELAKSAAELWVSHAPEQRSAHCSR